VKSLPIWIFLLSLNISFYSKGQTTFVQQGQAWFRYYNLTQFSEKTSLNAEIDERKWLNPWSQSQFFVHVHLHYKLKPWLDLGIGMNYNETKTHNQLLSVSEWRPWQEISLSKKLPKEWQFQFRYRLDDRFIHQNDSQVLLEGYHFNWRHRFRAQVIKTLAEIKDVHTLSLKMSDEVMLNSGDVKRTFDQNRVSLSLEYKLNKHWSIESGYLNQIQQIASDKFILRHVIRTTLYHRIDLRR